MASESTNFLTFLSTAPVLVTIWLSLTATFIIFINFVFPDLLIFPGF